MHAVLEHLWESTLFCLAAALLTLALKSNGARARYWVWFAASLKFLLPFSLLMLIGRRVGWPTASAAPLVREVLTQTWQPLTAVLAPPPLAWQAAPAADSHVSLVLLLLWAAGAVVLLARWLVGWVRLRSLLRGAIAAPIEAPIPVRFVPAPFEPGVIGIFRPVLLLPVGITERLSREQLQAVMAHELCHVRQRDNLTAAVHMLLEAAFWFHPLIWWIGARLIEERERACDEAVVELGSDAESYAQCLLKVCRFYMESRLACVAGVSGASLKKRIETIMRNRVVQQLSPSKKLLVAATAVLALAIPLLVGIAGVPAALAQPAAEAAGAPAAFDTVRITQAAGADDHRHLVKMRPNGTFTATRLSVRELIAIAYGLDKSQVIGGPDWLDQPLYDISAHVAHPIPAPGAPSVFPQSLKAMLAERFALVVHSETHELPSYALRVAPSGSKLDRALVEGEPHPQSMMIAHHELVMAAASDLKALTQFLTHTLGRPVIDETGLQGRYDFALTGTLNAETLPTMLREQLGLTIEPTTAPVEELWIDSVEQPSLDSAAPAPST